MAGPVRRKRETTGTSSGVKKRGEGLGTGSVGNNSAGAQHASGKRPSLFGFGSSRPQSDYSQANQDHERDQSRNVSRAGGLGGGKFGIIVQCDPNPKTMRRWRGR